MLQGKLSEIEEKRKADHSVQSSVDDGKGKIGVAKKLTQPI